MYSPDKIFQLPVTIPPCLLFLPSSLAILYTSAINSKRKVAVLDQNLLSTQRLVVPRKRCFLQTTTTQCIAMIRLIETDSGRSRPNLPGFA